MVSALDRWSWLVAELNGRVVIGMPGVRDPEHVCEEFDPGSPDEHGSCDSDGHYMCYECKHLHLCGDCKRAATQCECSDERFLERHGPPRFGWLVVKTEE
jgi:hypothetical protein